jgi:hypothetical protein
LRYAARRVGADPELGLERQNHVDMRGVMARCRSLLDEVAGGERLRRCPLRAATARRDNQVIPRFPGVDEDLDLGRWREWVNAVRERGDHGARELARLRDRDQEVADADVRVERRSSVAAGLDQRNVVVERGGLLDYAWCWHYVL